MWGWPLLPLWIFFLTTYLAPPTGRVEISAADCVDNLLTGAQRSPLFSRPSRQTKNFWFGMETLTTHFLESLEFQEQMKSNIRKVGMLIPSKILRPA